MCRMVDATFVSCKVSHVKDRRCVKCFLVMLLRPGVRRPRRKNGRRKYRWVSAEGWAMVKKLFPRAADQEYPAGTEPCSQCEEQVGTTIYEIYYGVGASAVPLSGVL